MAELKDITVVALDSSHNRAVVKTLNGKMMVIKPGDTVPDSKAIVSKILSDRMVVIDTIGAQQEKKQTVWIYKYTKENVTSRIQRLDREGPKSSHLKSVVKQEFSN